MTRFRFSNLKNSKINFKCDRDVPFFAVDSRYTSQSLDFVLTVNKHELITVKILNFYPAHFFDLSVINGLYKKDSLWHLDSICAFYG